MTNKTVLLATPRNSPNWDDAWDRGCWLAAVRRVTFQEIAQDDPAAPPRYAATEIVVARAATDSPAQAVAEIGQAYATIVASEHARDELPAGRRQRKPRSIGALVGSIWISTMLVVTAAIGALVHLLG
jgi:hypothetical protein